jgi:glyoxylase-like metal-dependent hydrolase (beta-lactamase superfamily II)
MSLQDEVDRLIDDRPGRELLVPKYDDPAHRVTEFLYRSGGTTASYCLLTPGSRVIVNTGLGYEAPHHKRVFDAVSPGPTPYIITTQAHVDHVGGVGLFREPGTVYVAQARNPECQRDDARIKQFRLRTAGIWFDTTGADAVRIAGENPGVSMRQDVDGLRVELVAAVGETVDSAIVWLPQHRTALVSNLLGPLFPHFPNLNTLRGDRYRFVEPYLASVETLRSLKPAMLVTGRHEPITGEELIDACLERLHDAVAWVHDRTVSGMNDGVDLWTLMREIRLPPELRVGEGYGKVPWAVRTIWESYAGWFKLLSTTELYPDRRVDAVRTLAEIVGVERTIAEMRAAIDTGDPVLAIHLGEAVLESEPEHPVALELTIEAHTLLLRSGGDTNFWEHGWLRSKVREHGQPGS